jgi:hypothetical protein
VHKYIKTAKNKCSKQIYARVDLQREVPNPPQLFGIIFFNVCERPFCECERARELLFHFFCVQKELSHTHAHSREYLKYLALLQWSGIIKISPWSTWVCVRVSLCVIFVSPLFLCYEEFKENSALASLYHSSEMLCKRLFLLHISSPAHPLIQISLIGFFGTGSFPLTLSLALSTAASPEYWLSLVASRILKVEKATRISTTSSSPPPSDAACQKWSSFPAFLAFPVLKVANRKYFTTTENHNEATDNLKRREKYFPFFHHVQDVL